MNDYIPETNWEAFLLWTEFTQTGFYISVLICWVCWQSIVLIIAKMTKGESSDN
jgi:hypothetical protein